MNRFIEGYEDDNEELLKEYASLFHNKEDDDSEFITAHYPLLCKDTTKEPYVIDYCNWLDRNFPNKTAFLKKYLLPLEFYKELMKMIPYTYLRKEFTEWIILNIYKGKEPCFGKYKTMLFDSYKSFAKRYLNDGRYTNINRIYKTGAESPNWKGGISTENHKIRTSMEYKEWRLAVFKRDKYTCQFCGQVSGKLNAHHKSRFHSDKKNRLNVDNGITLCEVCHKKIHKIEGR